MRPPATTRELSLSAFVILFSLSVWGQAAMLPVNQILSRMQSAEQNARSHAVPYSVTRQYVLSDLDPKTPDSRVSAEINFIPPFKRGYTLGRVQGSDRVGKIVRRVLDHEAEMANHADRQAITTNNYSFALVGSDAIAGRRCYVLRLVPKRDVPELVRGSVWVDTDDFRIRRIAGQPGKSPSWWIKDLQVTIDYGDALGAWTQLATRATADVRWMGKQIFTSQTLDVRTPRVKAKNVPQENVSAPPRKGQAPANSAIWVAR